MGYGEGITSKEIRRDGEYKLGGTTSNGCGTY